MKSDFAQIVRFHLTADSSSIHTVKFHLYAIANADIVKHKAQQQYSFRSNVLMRGIRGGADE
jgi:hypothetical protein